MLATSCVKTEGKIKLTYTKAKATYGDLDSLRALPLLRVQQPVENPTNFYIGEDYILVGEQNKGIHIFDNIDMSNPQRVSFINIPYNKEYYVKGDILYAESLYDVVKIDISDVYNPQLLSRAENVFWTPLEDDNQRQLIGFEYVTATDEFEIGSPEAKAIKKQGRIHVDFQENIIPESNVPASFTGSYGTTKGTVTRMAAEYDHLYIISDDKLFVLNDMNDLEKVREKNIENNSETIYAEFGRLYIGSTSSMRIYDVMNPSNPSYVSELSHTESCDPVLPTGEIAYYTLRANENEGCNALGENTLNVVDLSNEQEPQVLTSIEMNSPYGLGRAGNYLMVGDGAHGIAVFDIQYPEYPVLVNQITGVTAYDVIPHPHKPNVIVSTNEMGIQQFEVDWNTLTFTPVSQIIYN